MKPVHIRDNVRDKTRCETGVSVTRCSCQRTLSVAAQAVYCPICRTFTHFAYRTDEDING